MRTKNSVCTLMIMVCQKPNFCDEVLWCTKHEQIYTVYWPTIPFPCNLKRQAKY